MYILDYTASHIMYHILHLRYINFYIMYICSLWNFHFLFSYMSMYLCIYICIYIDALILYTLYRCIYFICPNKLYQLIICNMSKIYDMPMYKMSYVGL